MRGLRFEWDSAKAAANRRKHNMSFPEARTVFYDESARLIDDPEHSDVEPRLVLLGLSFSGRVVVVHHTYRSRGHIIRIISARKATRGERAEYDHWRRL